jgi:hypothetical protein
LGRKRKEQQHSTKDRKMKKKALIFAVAAVWFGTVYFMTLATASALLTTVA